jgi:hypothetical protein
MCRPFMFRPQEAFLELIFSKFNFSSKDEERAHGGDPMRPSSNHVLQHNSSASLHAAPRAVF